MADVKQIDKLRLTFFSDALMAIIMTILVLDIKVPEGMELLNQDECFVNLLHVFPHFLGFILSFAFIIVLWFAHHDLIESIQYANRPLAVSNFCFLAATATLPFSTALAAAYPFQSYAVATLALNMLVINTFLAGMYIYANAVGLTNPGYFPVRYQRIKQAFGLGGEFVFLLALLVSFRSPTIALVLIAFVPIMHLIPISREHEQ
jgi:uncharacterized membrane protein